MRVLLVTPPMIQLNTPYPATAYLTGFLRLHAKDLGLEVTQADASITLFLRLFSAPLVTRMAEELRRRAKAAGKRAAVPPPIAHFLAHAERYADTVEPTIRFLQRRDPSLAFRIVGRAFLPEGPRFEQTVDETLDELTRELLAEQRPDIVCVTAPFPGNVYGAFRMARTIRKASRDIKLILGGGWVNTELRSLRDPRVFDYFDYLTLDDGERPLLSLLQRLRGRDTKLVRTYVRKGNEVVLENDPMQHDIPQRDTGIPTYDGLPLDRYVSVMEMLNPMHRFWSDGRWNKITLAHGCYWKKCSFCDVSLDYIGRYDKPSTDLVMERIKALVAETGESGFHLVDEAAPPAGMRALAKRLLAEKLSITWWGNIRFEKTFTPELCRLLAESGCVAVSGGLEVASDRLLELMKKGVTVEQVARVTRAFTDAGIMVHAYLMYGFPTETEQDTVDALERVRQLFAAGCIQSAYWHRFSATAHSPIGLSPHEYGITLRPPANITFAHNDVDFVDPTGTDHDYLGTGLRKALYNYMHGVGLEDDVREWFEPRAGGRPHGGRQRRRREATAGVPATTVPPNLIERFLD